MYVRTTPLTLAPFGESSATTSTSSHHQTSSHTLPHVPPHSHPHLHSPRRVPSQRHVQQQQHDAQQQQHGSSRASLLEGNRSALNLTASPSSSHLSTAAVQGDDDFQFIDDAGAQQPQGKRRSTNTFTLQLPTSPTSLPPISSSSTSSLPVSSSPSTSNPSHTHFYYKLVAQCGPNTYKSIYDGTTQYVLGQTMQTRIKWRNGAGGGSGTSTSRTVASESSQHQQQQHSSLTSRSLPTSSSGTGGFYVCSSLSSALSSSLPTNSALLCAPRVLLKVLCWGDCISHGHDTFSFTHLRPVQIYPLSMEYRCTPFGAREVTQIRLNETRKRLPQFYGPGRQVKKMIRAREEMGSLTRKIMSYDQEITKITRAQLSGIRQPDTTRWIQQ